MTVPDTIGPLIGTAQVVTAVEATLAAWLPATLLDVADRHALELAEPDRYLSVVTADSVRDVDRVTVAVASPGLAETGPRRSGNGYVQARYSVLVSVFVRADDYRQTLTTASAYAVAVRTALTQHPELDGLASDVAWNGEEVAPVAGDDRTTRTLALAVVEFVVTVPDVLYEYGEPSTRTELGGPTVTTTSVTLTPKE